MGNPAAAVKVVEYVSLTCPHCRSFSEEGAPALVQGHVRSGHASFEIRAFPLDPVAAVGAQLNRCAAPAQAFALNDAILAGQPETFARLDSLTQADVAAIQALAPGEQRLRIAQIAGLDVIAARHGLDAAGVRSCLADQAGADRIDAIKSEGERIGISGTPSFTVNGAVADGVHDWTALAPLLAAGR
jgi:protein-disulfide isomerase